MLAAAGTTEGRVLDLAVGTGYYLAGVLDQSPHTVGACLDLSRHALRRAAASHPRAAALGADVRRPLPLRRGSFDVALSVFGPRDPREIRRVLRGTGRLIVVSPTSAHLSELVATLNLIGVDPDKTTRQQQAFADFDPVHVEHLGYQRNLTSDEVQAVVGMGPTGVHLSSETIARRASQLPNPTTTTISVNISTYAP